MLEIGSVADASGRSERDATNKREAEPTDEPAEVLRVLGAQTTHRRSWRLPPKPAPGTARQGRLLVLSAAERVKKEFA